MRLIVYSKSTERYINDWVYDEKLLVSGHPTEKTIEKATIETEVIAIGGGSVIDTAKIFSKNPIIAIPTTLAGASRTSHAVYWDGDKKCNFQTPKPITITNPYYIRSLPNNFYKYTRADCICHIIESLISKKATEESKFYGTVALELLKKGNREDALTASLLAADAFEITGTNLLHALSYPLTIFYKIPHGKALLFLLPRILPYLKDLIEIDLPIETIDVEVEMSKVIDEAFKYPKIFETRKTVDKNILIDLLGEKQENDTNRQSPI